MTMQTQTPKLYRNHEGLTLEQRVDLIEFYIDHGIAMIERMLNLQQRIVAILEQVTGQTVEGIKSEQVN